MFIRKRSGSLVRRVAIMSPRHCRHCRRDLDPRAQSSAIKRVFRQTFREISHANYLEPQYDQRPGDLAVGALQVELSTTQARQRCFAKSVILRSRLL